MNILKKFISFACLTIIVFLITFCTKESKKDEERLKLNQKTVKNIIESAGNMPIISKEDATKRTILNTTVIGDKNVDLGFRTQQCTEVEYQTKYDVTSTLNEIITLQPWTDILWPGCLIQGKTLNQNNIPKAIPIYSKRKSGKIYLNVIGGKGTDSDSLYKEVVMKPYETIHIMKDTILKYLNGVSTFFNIKIESVNNIEEIAMKFGINQKMFGSMLKSEFQNSFNVSKNYVAVMLSQPYYTMTYEYPEKEFMNIFTDDIQSSDIEPYTGEGNPICYVSSVTYGRTYIMLYESEDTRKEMLATLYAAYGGGDDNSTKDSVETKKTLKKMKCTVFQMGGRADDGLKTITGDMDKIKEFIINGANATADNIGAPISFKVNQLLNNKLVRLSNTTSYTATERAFLPKVHSKNTTFTLYNLKVTTSAGGNGYHVSNRASFKLKNLKVTYERTGYSPKVEYDINKTNIQASDQNPATDLHRARFDPNIPIYQNLYLSSITPGDKIIVEMEFDIYGDRVKTGNRQEGVLKTFKVIRTYKFNGDSNNWEYDAHGDFGGNWSKQNITEAEKFDNITYSTNNGGVDFEVSLEIGLEMDGVKYPCSLPQNN